MTFSSKPTSSTVEPTSTEPSGHGTRYPAGPQITRWSARRGLQLNQLAANRLHRNRIGACDGDPRRPAAGGEDDASASHADEAVRTDTPPPAAGDIWMAPVSLVELRAELLGRRHRGERERRDPDKAMRGNEQRALRAWRDAGLVDRRMTDAGTHRASTPSLHNVPEIALR